MMKCVFCGKQGEINIRTLHKFPTQLELLGKWLKNMNMEYINKVNEGMRLCSEHFETSCLQKRGKKTVLVPGSVPTLFKAYKTVCAYCKSKKGTDNRLYHRFPLHNKKLLDMWLRKLRIYNFEPTVRSFICSKHFEAACYRSVLGKKYGRLLFNAVPTIFNPTVGPNISRRKTKKRNVKDELPELELEKDYVKEEAIDIEENELECTKEQLVKVNLLKENSDETENYEENKLVLHHHSLMRNFDKLYKEKDNIKKMLLDFAINIEALTKENQLLKEQLEKTSSYSENAINTEVIDLTDIDSICRVCLQTDSNLKYLNDSINFDHPEIVPTKVLDTLQAILSLGLDSITIGDDHLPNKICLKCVEQLKLFTIFRYNYSKSCEILKIYTLKINEQTEDAENNDDACSEISSTEDVTLKFETTEEDVKVDEAIQKLDPPEYYEVENLENNQTTEKFKGDSICDSENQIKNKKKPHKCPICLKELKLSQFRPHMHTHKGLERYFSGLKVPKNVKFYAVPNSTVSLVNEKEMFHKCPFCPESFTAAAYLIHVDNHLKNDQFTCDKCGRVFKKRSYLIQHLLVHTKELPYSCKTCKKQFVIKQNYEYHLLTHSYKVDELPYKCQHCDRKFSNPSHLTRHMTIHLENCSYGSKYGMKRCRSCLQSFSSEDTFKLHKCVLTGMTTHFCRYCGKSFATLKVYYHHLRLHHNVRKKMNGQFCIECNKVVSNLTCHRLSVHPGTVQKYLCPICGAYVLNKYSHMMKHGPTLSKPPKCNICGKEFRYTMGLKRHLMVHTGEKPFLCSSCPKTFSCKSNLQVHERIHLGVKSHVCSICDKGFLEKSYLEKHMKVHKVMIVTGSKQKNKVVEDYETSESDDY